MIDSVESYGDWWVGKNGLVMYIPYTLTIWTIEQLMEGWEFIMQLTCEQQSCLANWDSRIVLFYDSCAHQDQ